MFEFCSGLVDLVVRVCHHGGSGHRFTLAGQLFVDRVSEDTGVVAGLRVGVLYDALDVIEQVGAGASGGYPVAVEPVRNSLRKPHPGNGFTLEVRGVHDHEVAAVACRVVSVCQIPARGFVGTRVGRDEHGLAGGGGAVIFEAVLLGRSAVPVVADEIAAAGDGRDAVLAADGDDVAGRQPGAAIVDAGELDPTVVDLLFIDRAALQIDRPAPHHTISAEAVVGMPPCIVAPHLGVADSVQHD